MYALTSHGGIQISPKTTFTGADQSEKRDIFQFLGLFFPETFVQKPLISIINVRKGSVDAETQSEPFSPTSQTQTTSFRSTFVDLQMSFFKGKVKTTKKRRAFCRRCKSHSTIDGF